MNKNENRAYVSMQKFQGSIKIKSEILGVFKENCVEFLWVLVFDLGISMAGVPHNFEEILWNF